MKNIASLQNGPNQFMPLIALCLGFFMVILDVTIVNVALPSMAHNLKGGISWLQWVVDGYALTFACLLLSAGSLGDQLGARTAFLTGLVIFILTSVGCGLVANFWQLVFFRLLQGIGGALLVPTSLALIHASYSKNEERARAIGLWATIGGVAAAAGPLLGGFLTAWFGWRAVFFVNVPIGLLGFLLTYFYVANPAASTGKKHFDFWGQTLGIISLGILAFSLIEAGKLGWLAPSVIAEFIIFILFFSLFLLVEKNSKAPMLPLVLFHEPAFAVSIAVGMIINTGVYGQLFVLTLYFQQIRHYSVLFTGIAFMPMLGIVAIASFLSGRATAAVGVCLPMIGGLLMGAAGFFALLGINATTPYFWIIPPFLAIGFGVAFTIPAATVAAIHSAPNARAGIASGTLNACRQIGTLIGVALYGAIINFLPDFISAMRVTLFIAGVVFLVGCIAVSYFIKNYS